LFVQIRTYLFGFGFENTLWGNTKFYNPTEQISYIKWNECSEKEGRILGVFYKILGKHMMTLPQEKSINRNQTLTTNDEIGKTNVFSRKFFQAKFLLANHIKRFRQ